MNSENPWLSLIQLVSISWLESSDGNMMYEMVQYGDNMRLCCYLYQVICVIWSSWFIKFQQNDDNFIPGRDQN